MATRDPKIFPFRRRQTPSRDGINSLVALEKSLTGLSLHSSNNTDYDNEDADVSRTGSLGLNQLNAPTEPLVELIFVHGLGGGSRKSWSKTESEDHFWPKSWLPRDPDFHNVRIHSFGYKSYKSEIVATISGIPDIAQSLLSALRDNVAIRQSQNAIILIGHSMGGLVIKKAFIQAHVAEAYNNLASRIRSLYFLGTPHQGSGFTKMFQNLFRRVPLISTTENVADMDPASRLIESLNKDFPQVAQDIELRSFWETEQSAILGRHQFVVPKHSACLNYTNEVSDGLDADHRGICKYDRPTNSNYQKVRNALSASVEKLIQSHAARNHGEDMRTLQLLRDYLDIRDPPEDDLANHLESCLSTDTCSWFIARANYQKWRDSTEEHPEADANLHNVILVEADPGAGKSILAAQVINNLQALNCECSYFFFDAQDREKSTLSHLLRSLAFQMALLSPRTRSGLLELQEQKVVIQNDDEKYIWRKLFTNCILRLEFERQQYWVIDGLDECPQTVPLLQMLLRIAPSLQPKIFMTARPDAGIRDEIFSHQNSISHIHISQLDTLSSISDYVNTRTSHLRLRTEEDRADLVKAILKDADGSFLWVKLILDNINKATGPKQIMESIRQIPKGMDHLYESILEALDRDVLEEQKPVVKAVLDWTMCANPPLTTEELEDAVRLDTESAIFIDKMCETLRGLIIIDRSGKVRPIHQTARSYLLKPGLRSCFAVSLTMAHSKIAGLLVNHLHQRLRNLRNAPQMNLWQQRKQGIDDYALFYFSDHIRRAQPSDHDLFIESEKFFINCGISWIACIALAGSLTTLAKTSQNLRTWLQARLKGTPPMGELARKTENMQNWSVDLVRIVAKFGRHLLECPGAVYTLIPPFVPKESILSVSRPRPKELVVLGIENDKWDDRLCSKFYQSGTCTALASGKHNFAVGMKSGDVHIYDNNTMQLLRTVQHGAVVKLLKYNSIGTMLVTAGFRRLKMWTIADGQQRWDVAIRELRLAAEFIENDNVLISVSSQHKIIKQVAATGEVLETNVRRSSIVDEEQSRLFRRELQYAEFSTEAEMLATMQRERPIQLTDIEDRYDVGVVEFDIDCADSNPEQPITAMTFCANIEIALLAAVYRDGVLAVFDRDLRLMERRTDSKGATLLAGSPSGLHVAAASVEGVITLYDFEQLTPLHTLYTFSVENIRSLVFSGDGQRIIDVRDRQANVWAPAALFNRPREDTDSISESTLAPTVATSHFTGFKDGTSVITAIASVPTSDYFFCGQEDGSVAIYSTRDAKQHRTVARDPSKQWISSLFWKPKSRVLVFLCGTSTITTYALSTDWSLSNTLMRFSFLHTVKQILVNEQNDMLKLFVVTSKTIHLWKSDSIIKAPCSLIEIKAEDFESEGLWVEDTSGFLILAGAPNFAKFDWNLELVECSQQVLYSSADKRAPMHGFEAVDAGIVSFDRGASFSQGARPMLFLRSKSSQNTVAFSPSASTPAKFLGRPRWLVDLSSSNAKAALSGNGNVDLTKVALHASLLPVSDILEHVIGIRNDGRQLIFLDKKLWVCTYNLAASGQSNAHRPFPNLVQTNVQQQPQEYTRHLFIPDDWISSNYSNANSQLLFTHGGAREDCLIFVKKHEVAVIKNIFSYAEKIRLT